MCIVSKQQDKCWTEFFFSGPLRPKFGTFSGSVGTVIIDTMAIIPALTRARALRDNTAECRHTVLLYRRRPTVSQHGMAARALATETGQHGEPQRPPVVLRSIAGHTRAHAHT